MTDETGDRSHEPALRSAYVDTGEVRVHYVEAGRGSPMVFLHGFPETWYSWRHQVAHFATHHRVVACDLRGFGRSEAPPARSAYGMPSLVGDLRALLREVAPASGRDTDRGADRGVTVVGHDLGGLVAWACASHFPGDLRRLVVVNSPHPARLREAGAANPRQALRSSYVGLFRLPLLPEVLVRLLAPLALARITADPLARRHYREAIARPGRARGMLNHYRALPALGRVRAWPPVRVPVLVVWGTGDPFLGTELTEGTDLFAEDVTVMTVPGGGHWVHQRHPAEVNVAIERFIADS